MVIKGRGFTNGTIILEEPESIYYSGQLVSGNVHFELGESLSYSAINLVCLGEASVQRAEVQYEMSGGANRAREVKYEGREQYLNFMQCIFGGIGVSTLPPGVHSIPFQFQVPFNAPSSFKGEGGIIVYCITAYLEYPEPGRREELLKEFQVVAPINPNTLANIMRPLELDFEEIQTCNCFCDSKPIDLKIALPSSVFHVGTSIPINVKVKNDSSVEIYEICFSLTKRDTYRTQQPRSEYTAPEEILVKIKKGPVLSDTRGDYTWELPLPSVVLPNLENCSIIDVAYLFKVKIQMTGCNEPVDDESEIFIGVLPQSEDISMTSSDLAALLPKAPLPDPNRLPIQLITPSQNLAACTQVPHQYGSQVLPTPHEMPQKTPYEIGFRTSAVATNPPYPAGNVRSGYLPQPAIFPPTSGNSPYQSGPPPYNFNGSQSHIATAPSAPPL